jgi:hypothetical protein
MELGFITAVRVAELRSLFRDPGDTAPATILGNTSLNTDLEGAFYFPTARVSYAVSGPAKYNILVADEIDFILLTFAGTNYGSSFASDYSFWRWDHPWPGTRSCCCSDPPGFARAHASNPPATLRTSVKPAD